MNTDTTLDSAPASDPTPILSALKKARGRATVGDVVSDTGLPRDRVEATLRSSWRTAGATWRSARRGPWCIDSIPDS